MFSFMNALLLRPMPYPDPDSVVLIWQTDPNNAAIDLIPVASGNYADWRRTATSFETLAAQRIRPMTITGGDLPEPISGAEVRAEFFPLLGARTHLGRVFRPEEVEGRAAPWWCSPTSTGKTAGAAIRALSAGGSSSRENRAKWWECWRRASSSCRRASRCGPRWNCRRRPSAARAAT